MQLIQYIMMVMFVWSFLGTLLMCSVCLMSGDSIPEDLGEILFGIFVFLGGPIVWLTLLFGKINTITSV